MRLQEPALDLGICLAIASSFRNLALSDTTVAFGEVGLSGEVRAVNLAEQRVAEAERLGFTDCILPAAQAARMKERGRVKLHGVKSLEQALAVARELAGR